MATVRMGRLLEKELEIAAKKVGITKPRFIIDAVERALERKDPFELLLKLQADEEQRTDPVVAEAFRAYEQPYDTVTSRKLLLKRLKEKHRVGRAG